MAERAERLALGDEVVDHVGAEKAGKDADAFLAQRGVALGDDLLPGRALERADRVAIEIDEVGRRRNGPKIRAAVASRCGATGSSAACPQYAPTIPGAASSSGRAGDF